MPEWTLYSETPPQDVGVYLWRVQSKYDKRITVEFFDKFRERWAGHQTVNTPRFDHWDGYRCIVPPSTMWKESDLEHIPSTPHVDPHRFWWINILGIEHTPCPFCKQKPKWTGHHACYGGGIMSSYPHEYNTWTLKCCGWVQALTSQDPFELTERRNAKIASIFEDYHESLNTRMTQDRKGHHPWCNFFAGPAQDCTHCERLNREYPVEDKSTQDMMAYFFPDAKPK
jgi:hypothetical protein